jgi:hypothetical protein
MEKLKIAIEALETVRFGLTNENNKAWPTAGKAWSKKERDAAILSTVNEALAKLRN